MKRRLRDLNYGFIAALIFCACFWTGVAILIVRWF